jgi:hypothetical protein
MDACCASPEPEPESDDLYSTLRERLLRDVAIRLLP